MWALTNTYPFLPYNHQPQTAELVIEARDMNDLSMSFPGLAYCQAMQSVFATALLNC